MIRINLLPPEIVQKRKTEGRVFVLISAVVVALTALGLVYGWFALQAGFRAQELAQRQQETADLRAQADAYRVFETKKQDLQQRESLADQAFAGSIDWARMLSEVALVLPSDIWLESLRGTQTLGTEGSNDAAAAPKLELVGWATDRATDAPDNGHKSIAKLLVRLADLTQLRSVWLTTSEKSDFQEQPAIKYQVTAEVSVSTSSTAAANGVPGVPTDGGQ